MTNKAADEYIQKHYLQQSNKQLAVATGITVDAVQARLTKLKLNRKVKFKLQEDERIVKVTLNGVETKYSVSDFGRVRDDSNGLELKQRVNCHGYSLVNLRLDEKTVKTIGVHILVGTAFVENDQPKKKIEVNHDDGVKTNNFYKNLEWVTHKRNIEHAYETGLNKDKTNENSNLAKYSDEHIAYAKKMLNENKEMTASQVKKLFKLKPSVNYLNDLRADRRRKHI